MIAYGTKPTEVDTSSTTTNTSSSRTVIPQNDTAPVTETTDTAASSDDSPWSALKDDIVTNDCSMQLEAYYDTQRKEYLVENSTGWLSQTEGQYKRRLRREGYAAKPDDGELLSPCDTEILRVQDSQSVAYAGPLAGYPAGLHDLDGFRILITESPVLIEPADGDYSTLYDTFYAILNDANYDQMTVFFGWLQIAVKALRERTLMPGQVLVLAGPVRCGKSLIQKLLTKLLGGRSAKPYSFMTGKTDFNSEMFKAEHLMVEDESPSTDYRSRRNLGSFIKGFTVNEDQRMHAKNRDAIMLRPFWRTTISLNDEPEDLHVLPPIDDGLADKMIMMRAYRRDLPMPSSTSAERKEYWEQLCAGMPAFLNWLLNDFVIPKELQAERFGIQYFHHPVLLESLNEISNEAQLLTLIDQYVSLPFDGTEADLEAELYEEAPRQTSKLLSFPHAAGTYLGRLAKASTPRVQKYRTAKANKWRIRTEPFSTMPQDDGSEKVSS